jgi:benzoylformate decarboxylase/acetolactate synthase-1/2/3 large subunit
VALTDPLAAGPAQDGAGRAVSYGSDVLVDALQRLGVEHIAINPGASFRGLHESLAAAGRPAIVETLDEKVAAAIAHGYAKASNRLMAVGLHDLVGLQSGSMGIFNAFVDQAPMLILGGSGPADHTRRRPWIDWIHTARLQSLVARDYLKWDDQPVSIDAFPESLWRAHQIALAAPQGPTYVAVDALLQETVVEREPAWPSRETTTGTVTCDPADLETVADVLAGAARLVILADYVGRSRAGYEALVELAELTSAAVVDLGARHNFPNDHPNDLSLSRAEVLADADVVLALDLRDVKWGLSSTDVEHHGWTPLTAPDVTVLSISMQALMHRGFLDLEGHVDARCALTADTAVALPALVELMRERPAPPAERGRWLTGHRERQQAAIPAPPPSPSGGGIHVGRLFAATWEAVRDAPAQLAHLGTCPSERYYWARRLWGLDRYNAYLGRSGGGGIGYGLGASMGAALAAADDRLVVNLQPDGDALATASALWTAAHHRIPVLMVMVNNRMYAQERMHQSTVSRMRGRATDRSWAGVAIDDPTVDFALLARAQGVEAWGPVATEEELGRALRQAVKVVRDERRPALVDVVVAG